MQNQNEDNQNKALDEVREFMRVQEEIQSEKKKSFFQGLVAGLLLSMGITFFTMSAVQIFQQLKFAKNGQSREETVGENVTDALVVDKLGVLEEAIDKYFWQDVEDQTLQNGVYKGLLAALDDPYSVYYTTEELIALQEQTEGIYYGIGAYISQDKETGYVQISKIIKNTPAEESNLMQGDYIYAINGESMQGKDSTYVVSKIKGEEGSYVTITVIREGVSDPLDIEVERRKIESPTVEYEMHENGIAYIQITEFDLVTTKQFEDAYKQAKEEGMRGLIIDLRSNPGGNLSTVCDIARMILPKGLIVYTEDKYGERDEYSCDGKNQIQVPLVVLTNGYSASASEILAGAVKDYGIGKIMGTTTYGKGIVQKVINLSDNTAIKLTVSTYFTPNGNNIHKIGVEPDITVEFDADQYQKGIDNQVEAAKEELLGMIK
ncbi:MAG: S41 family peptidase [Lachnospiraceae bacterium]|jgi:carboxyl-terminal processing protease|nr:S41 family peptidase [Lachnospiraceae bacterium]